jgi:hypothetical protein
MVMALVALLGCSNAASTTDGGTGTGDSGGGASCATDPLRTGLTAMQTGVSVDAFDCPILEWSAKLGEPDPMIFKALMYGESRFDQLAVACPNMPCGTPAGWTAEESGCYGLMQIVLACNPKPGDPGLLPSGRPNLAKDMASSDWAGSIFNPNINVQRGIGGVAGNRAQVKKQFAGCTEDQYTMMAIGNYSSYGSTKGCTVWNKSYIDGLLQTYRQYAMAAGYPAHPY